MLEGYYGEGFEETDDQQKRLIAVRAALEIIKTSAEANTANVGYQKVQHDAKHAAEAVSSLADAIQAALN